MRSSSTLLRAVAQGATSPAYSKGLAYATDLVRRADHEAIYVSYFYPAAVRPAYLALRALNVELASLPDQVSNQIVGRMRFQWWKEALKGVDEGNAPPHPLVALLAALPQRPFLSSYHFSRLIGSREAHFLSPTFASLGDLAEYAAGTQASLLYLLLQATAANPSLLANAPEQPSSARHSRPFVHAGDEHAALGQGDAGAPLKEADDLTLDHAASHLAVANTIATLLRSIPHHASQRINVIPLEVAARHDLQEEALFRQGPSARGLQDAVASLAGIAEAELRTARECFHGTTGVPRRALPVMLSATSTRSYLERLASPKVDYNPFHADLHRRYWKLPFQVWGDSRKGTF
ncbi:hypothetical protein JCM6882_004879 [Rhodosporidiobolus microsporus]